LVVCHLLCFGAEELIALGMMGFAGRQANPGFGKHWMTKGAGKLPFTGKKSMAWEPKERSRHRARCEERMLLSNIDIRARWKFPNLLWANRPRYPPALMLPRRAATA
jgi:hypothetical protein